ncbi:hypothetical protein SARC_14842 [Sphaeroforma arctica JP610]|uniref:Uncharacterized protein n=1 Tax=Sphaeroforma arctica JP610 TaxID=667725 RepID=A0A0L0F927_9EUKA|nr:hypothetical protein SARC_14842 [Sphaeroforma arctica JP610]KNC72603.1 hypothetical protein SARC_14842 [Sphaeroforma arctica JP610]|eukprot:XP_014146505.1 hypothetical protein SARC_14842 [Sphaeroforma arctica JP610]
MAFFSEVETTFDFSASATGASARGTPTGPFLEASESILRLYDNLGSVAWKLIRSDFEAQMKVWIRCLKNGVYVCTTMSST